MTRLSNREFLIHKSDNYTYITYCKKESFDKAQAFCESKNGSLAHLDDHYITDLLSRKLNGIFSKCSSEYYRIGDKKKKQNRSTWTGGSHISESNSNLGLIKDGWECGTLLVNVTTIQYHDCDHPLTFICQSPTEVQQSTTIKLSQLTSPTIKSTTMVEQFTNKPAPTTLTPTKNLLSSFTRANSRLTLQTSKSTATAKNEVTASIIKPVATNLTPVVIGLCAFAVCVIIACVLIFVCRKRKKTKSNGIKTQFTSDNRNVTGNYENTTMLFRNRSSESSFGGDDSNAVSIRIKSPDHLVKESNNATNVFPNEHPHYDVPRHLNVQRELITEENVAVYAQPVAKESNKVPNSITDIYAKVNRLKKEVDLKSDETYSTLTIEKSQEKEDEGEGHSSELLQTNPIYNALQIQ